MLGGKRESVMPLQRDPLRFEPLVGNVKTVGDVLNTCSHPSAWLCRVSFAQFLFGWGVGTDIVTLVDPQAMAQETVLKAPRSAFPRFWDPE